MRSDKYNKKESKKTSLFSKLFKKKETANEDSQEVMPAENSSGKHGKKHKYKLNKKTFLKFVVKIIVLIIIVVFVFCLICIATAPKIDASNIYSVLSTNTIIYDDDGEEAYTVNSGENRTNVEFNELPKNLTNAIVAIEDKTFWKHNGFNFIRMLGAIKDAVFNRHGARGTSTLTQQLARNVYLKKDMSKRSLVRKIREAWYTIKLERALSKEQILEAYLNTVFMGFNCNGVEAASQAYFGKSVSELDLAQCATLAALPQAPSAYAPVLLVNNDSTSITKDNTLRVTSSGTFIVNDSVKSRRDLVLQQMLEQGYITQEECDAATKVSIKSMLNPNYSMAGAGTANYFSEYITAQVIQDLQDENNMSYEDAYKLVYEGGIKIYSTVDKTAQDAIESEFAIESNFPSPTGIRYDSAGNIINSAGAIVMYDYKDFFDANNGSFTFGSGEAKQNDDGSITIMANKRIHIYNTKVNGETDYSIEFPAMYVWENNKLYSIGGGYINVPQEYKSLDKNGNCVISKDFLDSKEGKEFFVISDGKISLPKTSYTLQQKVIQPQAAMTIVDNKTGAVKAMVGGRNISGQLLYNRATKTRQPGSSIKPIAVYSAALQQSAEECEAGKKHTFKDYKIDNQGVKGWGDYITAGSIVVDERTKVNGSYWPRNSNGSFSGKQTLRTAMKNSINTCSVKILYQVGVDYSADQVEKFGITSFVRSGNVNDMNAAALALGGMTNGVSTLEMANAYTVFAGDGTRAEKTYCYTKVTSSNGDVLLEKETPKRVDVLDEGVAWITRNMLFDVVKGGTGTSAAISGASVGGKTGTTDNQFDIWFDGFTPAYSASLWIGNDYNIKLTSMSGYAARLWGRIMNKIPKAKQGSYSSAPSNVESKDGEYYIKGTYSKVSYVTPEEAKYTFTLCEETGMLATPSCTHTEDVYFDPKKSTKPPTYYCDKHNPDTEKYPTGPKVPETDPDEGGETGGETGGDSGSGSGTEH